MFFLLSFPAWILQGLALKVLWGWFIADYFGIPQITVPVALGISLIVRMSTFEAPTEKRDELVQLVASYSLPLLALGYGWVVHLFM